MASPIPASAISEKLRKHVDPNAPVPLRLMAAKGMVPMGPRDMVTVLTSLTYDDDAKIADSATKSLQELPINIVQGALREALHPLVLDFIARAFVANDPVVETILINKETPDETFEHLAPSVSERLLGIILENQVRLLRHKAIMKAVLRNPKIIKSQVDRLMDFAVRTGVGFKGMAEYEEAKLRISGAPRDVEEERRLQKVIVESLPEDLLKDEEIPLEDDDSEEGEIKKKTLMQKLNEMTIAQKVALAQKGNRTIRAQLLKDRNKMVATAAIKNPGINDAEIVLVANNRAVCDDVIRIISTNREWTRNYHVKLALVNNPKTPLGLAMRFLTVIRLSDLKAMAKNKNIPAALATAAKKLVRQRQGSR